MTYESPSSNAQQLVRLQGEAPARVLEAVARGQLGVLLDVRAVQGLQEEMLEIEALELPGGDALLRIDELELVAGALLDHCAGLGADADPVDPGERRNGTVGLDRDFETETVQAVDQ